MADLLSEVEYGRILGSFTAVAEDFGDTVAPDAVPLTGRVTFVPSRSYVSYINSEGETASLYVAPVNAVISQGRIVGKDGKDGVVLLASNSNNVSASVLWNARISLDPIHSGDEAPETHDILIEVRRGEVASLIDVIKENSRVHNIALFHDAIAEAAAKFWERVESGEFRGNQGPPGPAGVGIGVAGPMGLAGKSGRDGDPGVGGNLLPDGNLEEPGFLVAGDIQETSDAVMGNKAATLSSATSRKIAIEPEKSYVGTVYVKSVEAATVSISQRVFGAEGDIDRVIENSYDIPADTWRKLTFLLDTNVGDQSMEIITQADGRTITVDQYTLSDNSVVKGLQKELTSAKALLEGRLAQLDTELAEVDSERERLAGSLNDLAVVLEDADIDLTDLNQELETLRNNLEAEETNRQDADAVAQETLAALDARLATMPTEEALATVRSELEGARGVADAAKIAAEEANTAANAASQAALEAAGIASSKGRIIVQETEPQGEDRTASNIWIKPIPDDPTTDIEEKAITYVYLTETDEWTPTTSSELAQAAQNALDAREAAQQAQQRADTAISNAATAQGAAEAAQRTADQATLDARGAHNEAVAAQEAAEEAAKDAAKRARVVYQDTAPEPSPDLLWFDTSDNNTPKVWFDKGPGPLVNRMPGFGAWELAYGAEVVDGVLFVPQGGSARSPLIPVDGTGAVRIGGEFLTHSVSPQYSDESVGVRLFNTHYYAEDGVTPVENSTGNMSNGNAARLPLGEWAIADPASFNTGENVAYMQLTVSSSSIWVGESGTYARDLWLDHRVDGGDWTDYSWILDGKPGIEWQGEPGASPLVYTGPQWVLLNDPGVVAAQAAAEEARKRADEAMTEASEAKGLAEDAVREVGDTVRNTVIEYAVGSSETVAPTSGWSTSTPTRTPGSFVWMRTIVTYADGDTSTTNPALLTGNAGAKGATGEKGDPGPRGADGVAGKDGVGLSGTALAYALSTSGTVAPTSGWTAIVPTPIKGRYLWTRTTWTYTDSTTETGYSVAYLATDGAKGDDGIAGKDGVGITGTAITYAVSSSGTTAPSSGWVASPPAASAGQFMWTRTIWSYSDSTTETGYSVGKIGNTGPTGPKGDQGSQGIQGPKGADGQPTYTWLKYADTPTSGMSDSPTGKKYLGLAHNKTTATESSTYSDYSWSLIEGPQGVQGPAGADGQPTYTWIKYGTSATGAGMSDSPVGKTYIGIAYNKTTATESTTASDYTWALIQGPQGNTGATGVSVTSVTPFFRAVARTAAAPAQPSGMTPSGWVTTEPAWSPSNKLYRAERIVYSNGTVSWTAPTLVAAYEGIVQVQSSVNGKNSITSSTSAPTSNTPGVVAGDAWYRVDSNGDSMAMWIWSGTAWVASKVRNEMLDTMDVNKLRVFGTAIMEEAVINKIWADGISAKALTTNKLVVATGNLVPDGDEMVTEEQWAPLTRELTDKPASVIAARKTSPGQGNIANIGNQPFPVTPGQEYSVQIWVKADKPGSKLFIELRDTITNTHGGTGTITDPVSASSADYFIFNGREVPTEWTLFRGTWTPNAGVTEAKFGTFYFNHTYGTERGAVVSIAGLSMRPKVGAVLIENGAISGNHLTTNSVDTGHLRANAVSAEKILAGAVTTDKMIANSISGDRIKANTLDAGKITSKTITATQIKAGTISAAEIASRTITADKIVAGSITSNEIKARTITAAEIAAGTIQAENISAATLDVLGELTVQRLSGEHIYGTVVEGGEIRTTDGLPGQVILSDEGYVDSAGGVKFPGITIIPVDTSELVTPPGMGPNGNGFVITGGRNLTGGRGFSIYSPGAAEMRFVEGNASSDVRVGKEYAWIIAQDGKSNYGEVLARPTFAQVKATAADGAAGLIEATPRSAVVTTKDPGGNMMSRIMSNGREAYLWSTGSDGLGRVLSVDSDGVWAKAQRNDGSGFWDHVSLVPQVRQFQYSALWNADQSPAHIMVQNLPGGKLCQAQIRIQNLTGSSLSLPYDTWVELNYNPIPADLRGGFSDYIEVTLPQLNARGRVEMNYSTGRIRIKALERDSNGNGVTISWTNNSSIWFPMRWFSPN